MSNPTLTYAGPGDPPGWYSPETTWTDQQFLVKLHAAVGEPLATAMQGVCREFVKALGTRATHRRRPRRVAKKIAARGGYMRHDSVGALCAKEPG